MAANNIYFLEPNDPTAEEMLSINDFVSKMGYNLCYSPEEVYLMAKAGELIRQHGVTKLLSFEELKEEILPDSAPRDVLVDTLRYKLNRIAPTNHFLLIDPYMFPQKYDSDFLDYMIKILSDTISNVARIDIVTLSSRNQNLAQDFCQRAKSLKPTLNIDIRYSSAFHDRFWIADEERGLFVGTSLNGIGKRYAVVDYLDPRDAKEIFRRFQQIP